MSTEVADLLQGKIIDLADQQRDFDWEADELEGEEEEVEFDDKVNEMVGIWNRENLLRQAEKFKDEKYNLETRKCTAYYDGVQKLEEMTKTMKEFLDGRVFIEILESNPEGKKINQLSTVKYDKLCYLDGHETPFESTTLQGRPDLLKISDGPAITGLLCALVELREGERANIIIHPALAYGPLGCPPLIPGDSYLFYNVKIHRVWEDTELDTALYLANVPEGLQFDIDEKIVMIKKHKDVANQLLKDDMPKEAVIRYKAAIHFLLTIDHGTISKTPELRETLEVLYQNSAITFNKLKLYKSASKFAKKCLSLDPQNVKALYQLAKARLEIGDHNRALTYIERAMKLEPDNQHLKSLRANLDRSYVETKKEREETLRRMGKAFC